MTEVARPDRPEPELAGGDGGAARVTTLELFFDLVFVLTITQLTEFVLEEPSGGHVLRAGLMLTVIFWMYGAYAWLTNAVAADRFVRRAVLLGGMAGFLLISLAIPVAFDDGHGVAFGVGYLLVVALHSTLYLTQAPREARRAIWRVIPFNLATALLVLAATAIGGDAAVVLLALAIVPSWVVGGVRAAGSGGFEIGAEHFAERHGLVVIVAIGESIVEIGRGAAGLPLSPELLLTALLALLLSAALWWSYFGGDDERAALALGQLPVRRRGILALVAFGHWHVVMLFGIVLTAAGVETVLAHPFHEATTAAALLLACGVALFVTGEAGFRRTLRIGRSDARFAVAAVALLAIPVATQVAAVAALAAIAALLGALFWLEAQAAPPASPNAAHGN